jgi:hypothetical protein
VVLIAVAACAPAGSDAPSTPAAPLPAVGATAAVPQIASGAPTIAPPALTLAPLPSVALPTLAVPSLPPLTTALPLPTGPLPTPNVVKPSSALPTPSLPVLPSARLTFPVNPVSRGGLVTAIAASEVGALCSVTAPWATLATGQTLDARRIDITGQTSWIWTVGLTVTPGQQPVDLSCVTSAGNAGGRFFVSVN